MRTTAQADFASHEVPRIALAHFSTARSVDRLLAAEPLAVLWQRRCSAARPPGIAQLLFARAVAVARQRRQRAIDRDLQPALDMPAPGGQPFGKGDAQIHLVEQRLVTDAAKRVAGVAGEERLSSLIARADAGDFETLAAVLTQKGYLSGVTDEQLEVLRKHHSERNAPEQVKRKAVIMKAIKHVIDAHIQFVQNTQQLFPQDRIDAINAKKKAASSIREAISTGGF